MDMSILKKVAVLLLGLTAPFVTAGQQAPDVGVVVYKGAGEYEFIVENVRDAVMAQGMVISGTLHVADMLSRTAGDLGFSDPPYVQAESIE
jgi:hypothetical protein